MARLPENLSPRPAPSRRPPDRSHSEWDPSPPLLIGLSAIALSLSLYLFTTTDGTAATVQNRNVALGGAPVVVLHSTSRPTPPGRCLRSLSDMLPAEIHPSAGPRHAVDPPAPPDTGGSGLPSSAGTNVTLVCCETTAGPLSMAARGSWAPRGVERFLDMVRSGHLDSGVPFYRCIGGGGGRGSLCQFGAGGSTRSGRVFREVPIPDDPNWLPPRQWDGGGVEEEGGGGERSGFGATTMRRFPRGYLTFAADGEALGQRRTDQLVVSLSDTDSLGGKPWEVPWGELVGRDSYITLGRIFTGYGENGPRLPRLRKEGGRSMNVRALFPAMDYILGCKILDERSI